MSIMLVIDHIQHILNECGDPVILTPIGQPMQGQNGNWVIELEKTFVLRRNKCCELPPTNPMCKDNPEDSYCINRIRISNTYADDYSKQFPLTNEQMRSHICIKQDLFGCYP